MREAIADSASYSQAIDFGTIRVSNIQSTASVILGTNGSYGTMSNIATSSGQKSGIVNYTTQRLIIGPTIEAYTTATGTLTCSTITTCSGCSIAFNALTVSPTSQSFSARQTKAYNYGGTISIPANCGYGTFSTSLTVSFSGIYNISTSLPVTVVLEPQPIQVEAVQDLSFGAMFSTATHDVIVNTNGSRQSSSYVVDDATFPHSNGIIKITKQETPSRSVTVAVDNQTTISNGGTSLTVTLTTSPVASSVTTLTDLDTYINVGGTLHVLQGTPAGEYSGIYNVVVTY